MANASDSERFHEDLATSINDALSGKFNIFDLEGALEAVSRTVVEELAALLDRPHWCRSALIENLQETGGSVLLELPAEDCAIELLCGVYVVGVDGEMGELWEHTQQSCRIDACWHSILRLVMSITRHNNRSTVRSHSIIHPPGRVALPTQPGWDCIVFAHRGLFTGITKSRAWTIPVHRALCVPDGTHLRIDTARRVAIRSLYLHESLGVLEKEVRVVNLAPLTRELISHAVKLAPMNLDTRSNNATITLLGERLAVEPDSQLHLPLPADDVAKQVATAIMSNPAVDLELLLRAASANRRTIERRFTSETAMSLGQWRRRARILAAVAMLAKGDSVTLVAASVGYSSSSSFVAAFRSELGAPPREFMRLSSSGQA